MSGTQGVNLSTPLPSKPLKHLNRIASRSPLNLQFRNLRFSVKKNKNEFQEILHSVSGQFNAGELTAILGPSGAGKSTLLNILAGLITLDVEGEVTVNGQSRTKFKKISSYIMQENIVQPHLTVRESMIYASNFKLGTHFNRKNKKLVVDEVISFLGLEECVNTFSDDLSGGQCRRLIIALELVCNSPIIFLDEPTTGLDDFTTKQCIDLLNKISRLGRTVVCTIHQPSASLFQYFDQLYVVADGFCVFNGSPNNLVDFLSNLDCHCPSSYTPADYIIELVHSDKSTIETLKSASQNGKTNFNQNTNENNFFDQNSDFVIESSFFIQFTSLLSRMFLQIKRNKIALTIQFLHHICTGLIFGALWNNKGNDAAFAFNLFLCFLSCSVVLSYTYLMATTLLFPYEVELLKREYFNGWYSLKAYFCALTISSMPFLIIWSMIYLSIVYFFTDQPKELDRFLGFCLTGIFTALASQSLGYLIGANFSVTHGSVIGSAILIATSVLANYAVDFNLQVAPFWDLMMKLSFVRHGTVGMCNAIFYSRENLVCEKYFCPLQKPSTLLKFLSMVERHYSYSLGMLLVIIVVLRIATYFSLKGTVNSEFYPKLVYRIKKGCHR